MVTFIIVQEHIVTDLIAEMGDTGRECLQSGAGHTSPALSRCPELPEVCLAAPLLSVGLC